MVRQTIEICDCCKEKIAGFTCDCCKKDTCATCLRDLSLTFNYFEEKKPRIEIPDGIYRSPVSSSLGRGIFQVEPPRFNKGFIKFKYCKTCYNRLSSIKKDSSLFDEEFCKKIGEEINQHIKKRFFVDAL